MAQTSSGTRRLHGKRRFAASSYVPESRQASGFDTPKVNVADAQREHEPAVADDVGARVQVAAPDTSADHERAGLLEALLATAVVTSFTKLPVVVAALKVLATPAWRDVLCALATAIVTTWLGHGFGQVVQRTAASSSTSAEQNTVTRTPAETLRARGCSVWSGEFELLVDDRLGTSIDRGLATLPCGVTVLCHVSSDARGPVRELPGLVAREIATERVDSARR
jgi:hypothetical protein